MSDDDVVTLTYDEAVALLPEGERVHTFVNPAGMLVGADWDRAEVLALLRAGRPERSGEQATAMGHGIVAFRASGPVFIETREGGGEDGGGDTMAGPVPGRLEQLEALAAGMLATFTKGQDGYRARAGQVAVQRWQAALKGGSDG
jgi:hypothetical protein